MRLDPVLVQVLINSICLEDYIRAINPLYHLAEISKFSVQLIAY